MERRKRVVRSPEERREQILTAAVDLFRSRGFDETTVQDIAEASGVATGTVYLYFPSKEHVLLAVHEDFHHGLETRFQEVATALAERAGRGETVDHRVATDEMFDALMAYNLQEKAGWEVMCRYFPRLPAGESRDHELAHFRFMTEMFRLGTQAGIVHTADPEAAGYVLGAVNIALGQAIAFDDAPEFERLVVQAKQLYYAALAPPADPAPAKDRSRAAR